jgi:hypothetical protein
MAQKDTIPIQVSTNYSTVSIAELSMFVDQFD